MDLINWITAGDKRSVLVKKNIIASFLLKGISILISLQVVPLTINYVNPTQYGIWLTLSSLMAWFFFFDIGLTHGFRNRFAEAKAKDDIETARAYVSTTYATLSLLFVGMIIIVAIINEFIDWSRLLNIDVEYREELSKVFIIIVSFFGLNVIFSTFTTMLTADQKPAMNSLIQVLGQSIALVVIYTLTKIETVGSLVTLAFVFSGIPVGVILISSIMCFCTNYKYTAPSFRYVQFNKVRDILGIGIGFFIITTSMLFIFNLMNVIISRILGPEAVTEYNIAYKYFNVIHMLFNLILVPFWSAFTDAYTRKDYVWMSKTCKLLERIWLVTIPLLIIMYLLSDYFYKYWIGDSVTISNQLNISVAIYMLFLMFGGVYMYMVNGIGKLRIQLTIYISFAVVAYPIMTFMCEHWGLPGLLVIPTIVFATQGFLCRIQLKKIINNTATGIWNR